MGLLNWDQYFVDTSCNRHGTETVKNVVNYKTISYGRGGKHKADYAVVWDDERKIIQVYFQETNGGIDWLDNLRFPKKMYDSFTWNDKTIKLYVHSGWADMYKAMKHEMHVDFEAMVAAHKDYKGVECIGWSLGSGQAMLATQDLNWKYGVKPVCITFGSVKPFWYTDKTTKEYLASTCDRAFNFCHRSDIVTYQPPFGGFNMLNRIDLGPFGLFKLFDPYKYHTEYWMHELYEGIPTVN